MRKNQVRRLTLSTETLRLLDGDLARAAGGDPVDDPVGSSGYSCMAGTCPPNLTTKAV